LKNSGNARGLLGGGINFALNRVANISGDWAERGVDAGVFAVDESALVDCARVGIITSSNCVSALASCSVAGSGDASRGGRRSRAFRFNNTGGSGTSGDFTSVTSRDDTSGRGNALTIVRVASVVQARISSSTDFRKNFTASWVGWVSDDDLTRGELGNLLAISRGGDGNVTSSSRNTVDGFGASSLGGSDLAAIEWSLGTDSSSNVTESDGTSIRDASSRAVGVWRRDLSTEVVDLNALTILAQSRASVGCRSTDFGFVFFAGTSEGIASVEFHTRIGWGRACLQSGSSRAVSINTLGQITEIFRIIAGLGN